MASNSFDHAGRLKRLRKTLRDRQADAALIFNRIATQYYTGFTGSYSHLIVDDRTARLVVDGRYHEIAEGMVNPRLVKIVAQPVKDPKGFMKELFRKGGYRRIAFERSISVAQWESYKALAGRVKWVPIEDAIAAQRAIKDEEELARIRKAARLADKVMEMAIGELRPGTLETHVSRIIRRAAEDLGGEGEAFENIVASGRNASRPHHHAVRKALRAGDMITIDLGVRAGGYCSDLTRTPALGRATRRFEEIHAICLEANRAAVRAVRPGITGNDLDAIARDIIASAGYGEYFTHSLGHGVGLEIHEGPRLAMKSEDVLAPGNVITIEPGIYIPGFGGVRIEDLVVVTDKGARVLSQSPRELRIV